MDTTKLRRDGLARLDALTVTRGVAFIAIIRKSDAAFMGYVIVKRSSEAMIGDVAYWHEEDCRRWLLRVRQRF